MNDELKNIIGRSVWTFVQAFIAALVLSKALNIDAIQAAAVAGVSAVLSAGKTVTVAQVQKRRQRP
jgi:hypothetical protein